MPAAAGSGRCAVNEVSGGGLCAAQAVFHLQTRTPPVLPPICTLFELPEDAVGQRPLHGGREAPDGLLEAWASGPPALLHQHLC